MTMPWMTLWDIYANVTSIVEDSSNSALQTLQQWAFWDWTGSMHTARLENICGPVSRKKLFRLQ